jgi:nucleotide-binding universal stress UspA family protein
MSYKTVLASLNDIEMHRQIAESAARLAGEFDAHLTGLFVIPSVEVYSTGMDVPIVMDVRHDYFETSSESVQKAFEELEGRRDFRLINASNPDIAAYVAHHGRAADLILLAQRDGSDRSMLEPDFVERVLLESGRPVVVLPRSGNVKIIPEVAVIGWNGRREAARAVFDSIPLLKRASEVFIVWVDPTKEHPSPGPLAGIEITEVLARHGIKAVIEPMATGGRDAGEALIEKVADSGADLLVMGAYGHARFTELILGGATRTVLEKMKCPIFFSH